MTEIAMDIRPDKSVVVFWGTRDYIRAPGNHSAARWCKRTSHGLRLVSSARARQLERIYRHPERAKTIHRSPFPRSEDVSIAKRTASIGWIDGSQKQKRASSWAERGWRATQIDAADGEGPIPWVLDACPSSRELRNGKGLTLMFSGAVDGRILITLVGNAEREQSLPMFTIALRPIEIRRLTTALLDAERHAREIIRMNQLHPGHVTRVPRWFRNWASCLKHN